MLGYLGYLKLDDIFLLANSSGMNRVVNPIISQGVWGAGWYNSATVAYADSQQNFEGTVAFELQALPSVWNMIADWLVEQRVFAKSFSMSPNGVVEYFYNKVDNDPRSGAWCSQASFNVDSQSIVTVSATAIALIRQEVANASTYTDIRIGPGTPTGPLNPSPRNLNPIPGWNAYADITWPNAPPSWSTSNLNGFVMMNGSVNVNNNTQVIRGCLIGRSRVVTPQGILKIKDLKDINGQLMSEYGLTTFEGVQAQGQKKTIRVKTRFGELRVSEDHRFRVLNKNSTLSWKRATEVVKGDHILGQLGNRNLIPADRGGDPEFWFSLGLLYGDGSYRKGRIQWTIPQHEKESLNRVEAFLRKEGIHFTTEERTPEHHSDDVVRTGNYYQVSCSSDIFQTMLPDDPGHRGSWRKHGFPEAVWKAGYLQMTQFLSGLYSADGGVDRGVVYLDTKYRSLMSDARALLRALGMVSGYERRTRKTPFGASRVYTLNLVGSRSMRTFRDLVGFSIPSKQKALVDWMDKIRGHADKIMGIPHASTMMGELFVRGNAIGDLDNRSVSQTIYDIRKGKIDRLADSSLVAVLDRAKTYGVGVEKSLLQEYSNNQWYFDEVQSVQPWYKMEEVYDPVNSSTNSYAAEGLIHHNCTADPNPMAVLQGSMAVDGSITLWRNGQLLDPYGPDNSHVGSFTASEAHINMYFGGLSGQQAFLVRHVLLTSDAFDIQGMNSPTVRTFGFTGLGDGQYPPFQMTTT